MHLCMSAYATVQKLLCHGNYRELILSLAKASLKTAGKWRKCESYFGASTPWLAAWAGHELGGLALTSADERVLSGRRAVVIA